MSKNIESLLRSHQPESSFQKRCEHGNGELSCFCPDCGAKMTPAMGLLAHVRRINETGRTQEWLALVERMVEHENAGTLDAMLGEKK